MKEIPYNKSLSFDCVDNVLLLTYITIRCPYCKRFVDMSVKTILMEAIMKLEKEGIVVKFYRKGGE